MTAMQADRRRFPQMRKHVNAMIADGAVILGRNPLKIMHRAKVHTLLDGILVTEGLELWPLEADVFEIRCSLPVDAVVA